MSTNPDDLPDGDDQGDQDDGDEEEAPRQSGRNFRRQLEADREALKAENAQLKRDAAFARVLGQASSAPAAKWLMKGYDGELTDEAIRQAATEAQILAVPAPASPSGTVGAAPPLDVAAYQRMAALSSPAHGATGAAPDLKDLLAQAALIPGEVQRTERIMSLMEQGFPGSTAWSSQ